MNDQDHDKEMMQDENETSWTPHELISYLGRLLSKFERWFNPKPKQKPKKGSIDPDMVTIVHHLYIHRHEEEEAKPENKWTRRYHKLLKGF